jgi:hypothetical protein
VVFPLDPYGGNCNNDIVNEDAKNLAIENLYKATRRKEDYINPTIDG